MKRQTSPPWLLPSESSPLSSCCHLFHGCIAAAKKIFTSATLETGDSRISFWPTTKIPHFILEFDILAFFPTHFQSFTSPLNCASLLQSHLYQKPTPSPSETYQAKLGRIQENQLLSPNNWMPPVNLSRAWQRFKGQLLSPPARSLCYSTQGEDFSPHSAGSSAPLPRNTWREQHTSRPLVVNPPMASENKNSWCFMTRPTAVTMLSDWTYTSRSSIDL